MLIIPTLLSITAPAEPAWFFPDQTERVVVIDEASTISGLPVGRSGYVVARVEDPTALQALPEVLEVRVLGGDGNVVRIRPRDGVDEVALSRDLHARGDVSWAHPDLEMEIVPHELPDDPYVGDQWHLFNTGQRTGTAGVDINAPLAWTVSTGGGAIIAVLDSGVDSSHPDLDVIVGWDYVDMDEDSNPDVTEESAPHGTAAAGVAAALGDNGIGVAGVAYDATVYGIRLIGGGGAASTIYEAFVEAVDAGAWVLSNSWGFYQGCAEIPPLSAFWEAMKYAERKGRGGLGTAVVFSAGNGNCDIGKDGLQAMPEVISVAATNADDYREGYSSFGEHVDVAAPSGAILTTDIAGDEGYWPWQGDADYTGYFSGTSASAPVVSGVLALMFAANPRLTAPQARRVLCETAAKVAVAPGEYDERGWSPRYGCGRVDAGAAVMAVANDAPGPPVVTSPGDLADVDRVVLRWDPVEDADGDVLTYTVTWWEVGATEATVAKLDGSVTYLDITGQVERGEYIRFTVEASDLWGPGPASAKRTFKVVDPVEELGEYDAGCECRLNGGEGRRSGFLPLLLGLVLGMARRRRRALRTESTGD